MYSYCLLTLLHNFSLGLLPKSEINKIVSMILLQMKRTLHPYVTLQRFLTITCWVAVGRRERKQGGGVFVYGYAICIMYCMDST